MTPGYDPGATIPRDEDMTQPHLAHLPPSVEEALQAQSKAILHAYMMGNKSTARAMMNSIPEKRIAYVTMWLFNLADNDGVHDQVARLICSVTE